MTRNIVMHVDGSRVLAPDRRTQGTGWAVVACHDDTLHERQGAIAEGKHGLLGGYHEHIAFAHGVLYAHEQGFQFSDVTILCDDSVFGYAQLFLHPQNYLTRAADAVRTRLKWVVKHCFEPSVEALVLQAFEHARIHKIKGHQREVYQERADYLARHAARQASGCDTSAPLSFETWLQQGIKYYSASNEPAKTWYAPFLEHPKARFSD